MVPPPKKSAEEFIRDFRSGRLSDESDTHHFADWVAGIAAEIGYTFQQAADHTPSQLLLLQAAIDRKRGIDGMVQMNIIGSYKSKQPQQSVNEVRNALKKLSQNHG